MIITIKDNGYNLMWNDVIYIGHNNNKIPSVYKEMIICMDLRKNDIEWPCKNMINIMSVNEI